MEIKYTPDNVRYKTMTAGELKQNFSLEGLFEPGEINLTYTDLDRAVVGSVVPVDESLKLGTYKELSADYFAQRREIGIINIGSSGMIEVDGEEYELNNKDGLYIGRESREIIFKSKNSTDPAEFYLLSYPAHKTYPTKLIKKEDAVIAEAGSNIESNERKIIKYILPGKVESCQLVMGLTMLSEGNVWNTMAPHTHERRTEIYMYFDIEDGERVFHWMGEPDEIRHMTLYDKQAILSPSWSLHSGVGTKNYNFIWGMGGENQDFDDMDSIHKTELE
jgi:4-deoxy-L-threo-5-hexosulose-uronate ketol-isomerase